MCSAVLSNQTETPLVFRLLSSAPFQIVYTDPETQAPLLQLLQTEIASLNPRQNMLVGIKTIDDIADFYAFMPVQVRCNYRHVIIILSK